ncbi:hypothetical protein SAMN06265379_10719 [Saccharicrinis carchari]|uniref:Outer membrane protein assembly factor BamA n=1 Tax=Saccharicrinis carchari TaxID=1168039 RepID=A0A521DXZ1_SACCC|nr:hypothetical protein [Saccharicrinis carchari]SMO76505.1 hypothetical protein SAMN06265379_10719 [Saccharicrinis carchari]
MSIWNVITFLLIILSLFTDRFAAAQNPVIKKDSSRVYEKLDSIAQQNKTVKILHDLLIKTEEEKKKARKKNTIKSYLSYSSYEGKIIRHIIIETLDPFGYSLEDTTADGHSLLQKTGNTLHIKSKKRTIKNLLLLQEDQPFDAFRAKESERLIREKTHVRDLSFSVRPCEGDNECVDIYIRVLDMWSILPETSGKARILSDKNFLGRGHELKHIYNHTIKYYGMGYVVSNIGASYISGGIHLGLDRHGHVNRRLSFERNFFSPLTKWAGGISLAHHSHSDTVGIDPTPTGERQFVVKIQDLWGGSSMQLIKGKSEYARSTNLISAARFLRVRYPKKPNNTDTHLIFESEDFYLGSMGVSTQRFLKEKYIFKFGTTEDLPIGKVINLTVGYQIKGEKERKYLGARFAFAKYPPWGYLSGQLEYGSFFTASNSEQGAVSMGLNYFTHLKQIGQWRFRQLIKSHITIGINPFTTDSLTINNDVGIIGFNSSSLMGTRRAVITLQTQSYAPFNILGFRFGPYLTWSGALLGSDQNGFKNRKLYQQFGLGVLIRNENLVLNTFQLSLAFYPSMPGNGNNIFRLNSLRTTDFGLNYFNIGKPATVLYK